MTLRATNGAVGTNAPSVLAQSAIPFIHLSSGTMGNNGAVSALTSLPITFSNGAYVYLPANAISTGSAAGWYWFVASSATAGTVYNSTYTSGVPALGTQTAFVTTGPGAFTGDISERVGPLITLPANSLGANGSLRVHCTRGATLNANNKTFRMRFSGGAGTAFRSVSDASSSSVQDVFGFQNMGVTNAQVGFFDPGSLPFNLAGNYPATASVDTTASQTIALSLNKAIATDNHILASWQIEVLCAA